VSEREVGGRTDGGCEADRGRAELPANPDAGQRTELAHDKLRVAGAGSQQQETAMVK